MSHIIALTIREVVRKRFLLVSALLSALFLALYGVGLHFAVTDMPAGGPAGGPAGMTQRLMVTQLASLAIYMSTFISAFFAVFSAAHTVAGELESGEMLAVASRPVHRWEIVLGKAVGIGIAAVLFSALLVGVILTVTATISGIVFEHIPRVVALYALQPLVLLSVTLLFGMFMRTIAAGISGMLVYMLGVIGGSTEQITAAMSGTSRAADIAGIARYIVPTDALYRLIYESLGSDLGGRFANFGPFGASRVPEWWMVAYAGAYVIVLLGLAVIVFRRRDL